MIKISKLNHRGRQRIMLEFAFSNEMAAQVRQIEGAAWSRTHRAWHIPDTAEAYEQLLARFPGITDAYSALKPVEESDVKTRPETNRSRKPIRTGVEIWVIGKQIQVRLPKNEADTRFLLGFNYAYWNRNEYYWVIPNYGNNLDILENYFNTRITDFDFGQEPAPKPALQSYEIQPLTELPPLTAEKNWKPCVSGSGWNKKGTAIQPLKPIHRPLLPS
jgi:integrase/recombinase XerD